MERFTKSLVVLSLLAAVYFEARLGSSAWAPLLPLAATALVGGFALASLDQLFAPRLVLFFTYLTPALFTATIGLFRFPFLLIWTAALIGLMLASPGARRWSWPPRWKFPLLLWALTIACAWPLIVLREYDYAPLALQTYSVANSGGGGLPSEAALWVMDVAVVHLVGLLWLDWLFRQYAPDRLDTFAQEVLVPLAAGALVASALGIYQGLFDLTFLSAGMWPTLRRATGSMGDANAFGMIAALWSAAIIALAACLRVRGWLWYAAGASLVCWGGLWMSGSRTALFAGAVGLAFAAYHAIGASTSRVGRARALGAATVLVATVILALALTPSLSQTPLARVRASLPAPTAQGALEFAEELWNRNEYGAAATRMIAEFPLAGVGVGAFQTIVPDYLDLITGGRRPPDNAQNWFRHQIAELGVLGSAGWMIWVALFATLLLTSGTGARRLMATAVKGTLAALALVSLVGMPAQNLAVTLTFWTFAFWYVLLLEPANLLRERACELTPRLWIVIAALLVSHLALTAYTSRHDLRVPQRAVRFDWPYMYGMSPVRRSGEMDFRWTTSRRAVAVIAVEKPWLRMTMWSADPDLSAHPVHAIVIVNGRTVVDTDIGNSIPVVSEVPIRGDAKRVMIEALVSRTWQPVRLTTEEDAPTRGLSLAWTFVGSPSGR